MIIWLTGQPASGKSTLAQEIVKNLKSENQKLKIINLDGDDYVILIKIKTIQKKVGLKIFLPQSLL